jgi:hypothetical protein
MGNRVKHLTVEAAFQWMQGFVTREWRLLLPVALAFFALPGLVVDLVFPNAMQLLLPGTPPGTPGQGTAMLAMVATAAIYCLGSLAVTALALVPGISVQEAIGRALRRWPLLVGSVLLVSAAILLVMTVLALLLGQLLSVAALQQLLLTVVAIGGSVLWVRLAVIVPVLVQEPATPVGALRISWGLTSGTFWRLFGALLLYLVGGAVVATALSSALGVVVMVAARLAGAPDVGQVVSAVLFRVIAAVISTGFQLLVVGLYRQLAPTRY